MITKAIDKLFSHRLFANTDKTALKEVLSNGEIELCRISKGETVMSHDQGEKYMCFIYKGSACVHSLSSGTEVLLKKSVAGEIFGVANLFLGEQSSVSTVIARENAEVLFIPEKTVRQMIASDSQFAMNYISFLSEKICFLNKRIACFTSPSAESKLEGYLYSIRTDDGTATLPVSLSSLAEMLDMGRASLYRAFDKLEADGVIVKDGKKIIFQKKCQF